MTLLLEKVSVSLGQKKALDAVSFNVAQGEIIGLIGPNGAGKSTLLRACARLLPLSSGKVEISGENIEDIHLRQFATRLAYLPQTREINWPIPVHTIVSLGRKSVKSLGRKLDASDYKEIHAAMNALQIGHLKDRAANQLSGGEKACVLMARALAQQPDILLADEPVAGLDPSHSLLLMQYLKKISQDGVTVIVVMHDLTLAAQFCDRLICLHKGKVAVKGSAKRVLSPENLKKVYGVKAVKARHGKTDLYIPVAIV